MDFEEWLVEKKLSPSTVKKYVGAIDGPLSSWANTNNITAKSLREVMDKDEFDAIAELIGGTEVFSERNQRGNNMYGAALNNYAAFLARKQDAAAHRGLATGLPSDPLNMEEEAEATAAFEPNNDGDARERIRRAIVQRRGQPKFRMNLLSAYEGRCAITHCPIRPILEAAHVTPYLGPHTNAIGNGILLRADIHTLWDLGLIAIEPNSMTVCISPTLQDPSYQELAGKPVFQPVALGSRAAPLALAQQWDMFQKRIVKDL